jgi:hypothetical protein
VTDYEFERKLELQDRESTKERIENIRRFSISLLSQIEALDGKHLMTLREVMAKEKLIKAMDDLHFEMDWYVSAPRLVKHSDLKSECK